MLYLQFNITNETNINRSILYCHSVLLMKQNTGECCICSSILLIHYVFVIGFLCFTNEKGREREKEKRKSSPGER